MIDFPFPKAGTIGIFVADELEGAKRPWHQVDERTFLVSPTYFEKLKALLKEPSCSPAMRRAICST